MRKLLLTAVLGSAACGAGSGGEPPQAAPSSLIGWWVTFAPNAPTEELSATFSGAPTGGIVQLTQTFTRCSKVLAAGDFSADDASVAITIKSAEEWIGCGPESETQKNPIADLTLVQGLADRLSGPYELKTTALKTPTLTLGTDFPVFTRVVEP